MERAIHDLLETEFSAHVALAQATKGAVAAEFGRLVGLCVGCLRGGGKLIAFGNGGSAADAQHLVTELAVRYQRTRPALAAIALTADTALLTAAGNDLGFEQIFARQIEAIGKPGDVALGLSTSGRSPNVIEALKAARRLGCGAAAFSGETGGDLPGLADPLILVPSQITARIQEMHGLLGHILCQAIEHGLGYVD